MEKFEEKKFDVIVSDFQWQHWNGGVFLFGETGYDFLDAWHKKTMQIFKDKAWRTRDQGTLIATVWEAELQNHTVLSKRFNLIADYNHESLHHKGNLIFETTEPNEIIAPELIHVYHHWADESWDVWKEIEKRTGLIANKESNIINLLFLKNELNLVELLTINSFVKQGHTVKLWTYSTLKNKLPESVLVGDAALIIPINGYSFLNQNNTKFKHKIDLFTNAFCYKLLYEYGGWWVNSDVTCLKQFDFDKSYFFTENYESQISDSVIKSPKGSMLMNLCYKEALDLLSEGQHIEYKSLNILDRNVRKLQLNNYIVKDVTGNQTIKQTIQLVIGNEYVPDYWYFINWQTKNWSTEKLNTQSFYFNSSLYEFLCNHGIAQPPSSIWQQWVNEFQFSSPVRTLKRMLVV